VAPAPHADGDPFWGSARSRRRGPLPGARERCDPTICTRHAVVGEVLDLTEALH